jgi:glyoxylase-like metal-dependent hydrolase (beta-lactamase superfamily II)
MTRSPSSPALGRQIADGVHVIGLTKGMKGAYKKGGYSRAYLFEDGEELILADALYDSDAKQIIDYLWSLGRGPADLKHIVLTHAHRSHIGGAATLKRLSSADVCSHASEKPIIEKLQKAVPVSLRPLRPLVLFPIRVRSYLPFGPHERCEVTRTLVEGDTVGSSASLEVLYAPGHTPGNLALLWKKRVLVVADAVLTWPGFGAGWPGFNLDEAEYRRSLHRLVGLDPEIVCVAHGDPILERSPELLWSLVS